MLPTITHAVAAGAQLTPVSVLAVPEGKVFQVQTPAAKVPFKILPALSIAIQAVAEVQLTPIRALVPEVEAVQVQVVPPFALVPFRTVPLLPTATHAAVEKQLIPFIALVPEAAAVQVQLLVPPALEPVRIVPVIPTVTHRLLAGQLIPFSLLVLAGAELETSQAQLGAVYVPPKIVPPLPDTKHRVPAAKQLIPVRLLEVPEAEFVQVQTPAANAPFKIIPPLPTATHWVAERQLTAFRVLVAVRGVVEVIQVLPPLALVWIVLVTPTVPPTETHTPVAPVVGQLIPFRALVVLEATRAAAEA